MTRASRESTRPLAVGVLGLGNVGMVHFQSVRATDGATVTAVADARADNRRRAREWGVDATYDDYEALLSAESVDVAVVALPPHLHEDALAAAAERGCAAFVEKPFARSVDEARRMARTADRAGVPVGVDHTVRYVPAVRRMKAAYDDGAVGRVPMASITRINSGPFDPPPVETPLTDWQVDAGATGGGAVIDLGTHLFDVLEWFFGECSVRAASTGRLLDLPFEDAATVVLEADDGATVATVRCGFFQWERPQAVNLRFRLDGVAGSLDSASFDPGNLHAHAARSTAGNLVRRARGETPAVFEPTYYYRAHYRALVDFLAAVRDDREPPVDETDGVRSLELVERVYAAAQESDAREREEAPVAGEAARWASESRSADDDDGREPPESGEDDETGEPEDERPEEFA